MREKMSKELRFKLLEMCADHIGMTDLIASALGKTQDEVNEIMEIFVKEGLVTKELEDTPFYPNANEKTFWYRMTEKGEKIFQ